MKKKNLMCFLFVFLLVGTLITINVPISEDFSIEKRVFEWVQGEQGREYTLVIDGSIRKNIISNQVAFEGDISIAGISDPQLTDVQMKIRMKKNGIVNLLLTRPGIHKDNDADIAINETLGIASIEGVFNKIIIFPHEKESVLSVEISDKRFWAENLEDASEIINTLKSMENIEIHGDT